MRFRRGRGFLPAFSVLAILCCSGLAFGQAGSADIAAAEALFQEGLRLVAAGRVAQGCAKLAESQRIDPQGGAAYELGTCWETLGKLGSAWGSFKDAAARWQLRGDKRAAYAEERALALEPKLSKITIVVPAAARVPGLVVKRNGAEVGEGQWDVPLPVDAGEVTLEATAPGRKTYSRKIAVEKPGTLNVEVPVLEATATTEKGAEAAVPFWGAQRIAAVSAAGVGVAGLVVGAVLAGAALGKKSEMDAQCSAGAPPECNDVGLAAYGDLKTMGGVSTGMFIGGGVLAAAGVVLWVTTPAATTAPAKDAARPAVRLSVGSSGVFVQGVW